MPDCRTKSNTVHHSIISLLSCQSPAALPQGCSAHSLQLRDDQILGFSSCSLSPVALSPTNQPTHHCSIPIGISLTDFVTLFSNFSLRDSQETSSPSLHFDIREPMAAPSTPLPLSKKSTSFSCCFIAVLRNTIFLCKYKCIFF